MVVKPFELVKQYTKEYPKCFEWCDKIHNDKGKNGLPEWDNICEIPIAATMSIMEQYSNADVVLFPSELAALYAWRKYKEIYSFDKDLAELLMSQAEDMIVPVNVLKNLPYPCIYVQLSETEGFFVWIESDEMLECRFLYYVDDKPQNFILHLKDGWTVLDGVTDTVETMKANDTKKLIEYTSEFVEWYRYNICRLLQLVLYICADNKEVEEDKEVVRRKQPTEKPKDVFREIRKWDVGYRLGSVIRKNSGGGSGTSTGTGSAKRPHTRRGHWHHFWTGHKDNQKIVLKWVAPMFINGDSDDVIPTEHKIK